MAPSLLSYVINSNVFKDRHDGTDTNNISSGQLTNSAQTIMLGERVNDNLSPPGGVFPTWNPTPILDQANYPPASNDQYNAYTCTFYWPTPPVAGATLTNLFPTQAASAPNLSFSANHRGVIIVTFFDLHVQPLNATTDCSPTSAYVPGP